MTDDITFCLAECKTDCYRQPKHIKDKTIPHSYADFHEVCMGYEPTQTNTSNILWMRWGEEQSDDA